MTRKRNRTVTKALDTIAETVERAKSVESHQARFDPKTKSPSQLFYQISMWSKELIFNEPKATADSRKHDAWLTAVVQKEPYLLGVLQSVVSVDKNRGWTLTGGRNQVNKFTRILHNFYVAPDLAGWRNGMSVTSQNYYGTNLGAVVEIGRLQKNGPLAAMYSVDSTKCYLTGDIEMPLHYGNAKKDEGSWGLNDYFRVVSMPSTLESMNGLGYCAVNRCIELAKLLVSVFEHDRERLGSKAPKGILTVNGITLDQWLSSLEESKSELKSLEREYYTGVQVLAGDALSPVSVNLTSLSSLPEQFDHKTFVDLIMFGYALEFGYDPREFWPVSAGTFGTSAETENQHRKASSKGGLDFALGYQEKQQEELPETLEFEFEQRDVDGDIAEVALKQANLDLIDKMYRTSNADQTGTITLAEARELLVEAGIIHEEWTLSQEDVQVTDTDDSGESETLLEKQRIRLAMKKFPEQDIVRYNSKTGKVHTIRSANYQHKFMIRATKPSKSKLLAKRNGVTITENDVKLAVEEAKKRIGAKNIEKVV